MKAREGTWVRNSEATFGRDTDFCERQKVDWGDMSEFNLTRDSVQKEYEIALGPILFTPNPPFSSIHTCQLVVSGSYLEDRGWGCSESNIHQCIRVPVLINNVCPERKLDLIKSIKSINI